MAAAAAATSITDLPEPLVLRILSDLPFPTVAKICTTSKRLYSAWNQIPHLHFSQFHHRDPPSFASYVRSTIRPAHRGSSWTSSRLRFVDPDDSLCREAVDYAVAHGVEELRLTLAAAYNRGRYHEGGGPAASQVAVHVRSDWDLGVIIN